MIMKKILMMVAFVAMTMSASAQSEGMKYYASESINLEFPEDFTAGDGDENEFSAEGDDNFSRMELRLSSMASSLDQMKAWCKDRIESISSDEDGTWSAGDVVVKGKLATVRFDGQVEVLNDDTYKREMTKVVKISFTMTTPNQKQFYGSFYYKLADEAKMMPAFEKMVASLKANQ